MKTYTSSMIPDSVCSFDRRFTRFLSLTFLVALAVSGGADRAAGADWAVQIHDNFFAPKQLKIAPGDKVQWTNEGNSQHTTTSSSALWNSGILNHGDSYSVTFSNLGSFPYFCQVHGTMMSGTINVSTNTAVTNDLFLVNLAGTFRATNALGKVVAVPEKSKDLVADCAGDHQLNPADLALVYDLQTDAIEVVRNDDGSTVCTMITFAGGANVAAADGKRVDRQAFVFWEDSSEASGSIVGTELLTRGTNGELLKFSFRGAIQFGLENYEDEPPKIFQGTLATGRKFVPRL